MLRTGAWPAATTTVRPGSAAASLARCAAAASTAPGTRSGVRAGVSQPWAMCSVNAGISDSLGSLPSLTGVFSSHVADQTGQPGEDAILQ
ncbi:hypothetical protein [Nonomuraea basaltis]|uniref:hypothetical protein n=1 Tax=Nonomuraea basaltis TaxID=2495887 RepID=UPI001F0ECA2C|nr:hypothetical protein [Nonomuraea basaltis]